MLSVMHQSLSLADPFSTMQAMKHEQLSSAGPSPRSSPAPQPLFMDAKNAHDYFIDSGMHDSPNSPRDLSSMGPPALPKLPLIDALASSPILLSTTGADHLERKNYEIHMGLLQHLPLYSQQEDGGVITIPNFLGLAIPQLVEFLYRGDYSGITTLVGEVDVLAIARWAGATELAELAATRLASTIAPDVIEDRGDQVLAVIIKLTEMEMDQEVKVLANGVLPYLSTINHKWPEELKGMMQQCPEVSLLFIEAVLKEREDFVMAKKKKAAATAAAKILADEKLNMLSGLGNGSMDKPKALDKPKAGPVELKRKKGPGRPLGSNSNGRNSKGPPNARATRRQSTVERSM